MGVLDQSFSVCERAADLSWELPYKLRARARAARTTGLEGAVNAVVEWPVNYDWTHAGLWVDDIASAFGEYASVRRVVLPQLFARVLVFNVLRDGVRRTVAIDYADSPDIDEKCAGSVTAYFKMQYRRGGYGRRNVLPGGYVPGNSSLYAYLDAVRDIRAQQQFRSDVFGRFGCAFAADVRTKAVRALIGASDIHFQGGLRPVRYSRYLKEIAQARVCVDLPGNGPLCFRLVDYLAVGACIVAVRHECELPAGLRDGEHLVYVRPDLSDLVQTCRELLRDEATRARLSANAQRFFDQQLHRRVLTRYYLDGIEELSRAVPMRQRA